MVFHKQVTLKFFHKSLFACHFGNSNWSVATVAVIDLLLMCLRWQKYFSNFFSLLLLDNIYDFPPFQIKLLKMVLFPAISVRVNILEYYSKKTVETKHKAEATVAFIMLSERRSLIKHFSHWWFFGFFTTLSQIV